MEPRQERRKFVRLNFLVDVIYRRYESSEKEKLSLSKNISTGGICLIAYGELKESDLLDLEIYLPDDNKPIKVMGRVVWVNEFIIGETPKGKRYDVGVEFIDIDQDDLTKIYKYVFGHLSANH